MLSQALYVYFLYPPFVYFIYLLKPRDADVDHAQRHTKIIIGSVVTRGSRSRIAPSAMAELNAARALFEKAAEYGGRAKKMLVRFNLHSNLTLKLMHHDLAMALTSDHRAVRC